MNKLLSLASILLSALISFVLFSCNNAPSEAGKLPSDAATIQRGETSFLNNCSSCHNFYHSSSGPQLAGITSDTSVEWLRTFIRNPQQMIESGDTRAQKLFKTYNTVMPSFAHLPDDELTAILAFMHTHKKKEKPVADTNDIKDPIPDSIPTSDLVVEAKLFTQIPASSDQVPRTRIIKLDYQPQSGELYILDLRGTLYKMTGGQPKAYMNIKSLRPAFVDKPGLATGFGSFAFHPSFASNGLLYTTHTELPSAKADFRYADTIPVLLQWVVTEWKTDPRSFPFSGNGREILRVNVPGSIHGMQEIAFRPGAKPGDEDYGCLYIAIGDGGSTLIGHPLVSPTPDKIWGSIIRIDPAGRNSSNGRYGIPPTNPFAGKQGLPEIYAYGFRNPHRFSWSKSGQLLAANIGERHIESLNIILPGRYYGWPVREGTFKEIFFDRIGKIYPLPPDDSLYNIVYPVAQYDHDEGIAISGGFEYKGSAIPALKGKYLFGDLASAKLFYVNMTDLKIGSQAQIRKWNITVDGKPTTLADLAGNKRVELRFGMDKKGEMYLLTKADGKIYKLVRR